MSGREEIWFLDNNDQPVKLRVASGMSDQEIVQSARDLRDKNVKPNWRCFQRLGYSRKAIRDFRETELYRNICESEPRLMPRQVMNRKDKEDVKDNGTPQAEVQKPSRKRKRLHPPVEDAAEEEAEPEEEGEE